MVDNGGQLSQFGARSFDAGRAFRILKADQIILIGHVKRTVHESQAIRGVEAVDEGGLQIGLPIAVLIAQQGYAVASFDGALAAALDQSGDNILGPDGGGIPAGAFCDQDVAIGQ